MLVYGPEEPPRLSPTTTKPVQRGGVDLARPSTSPPKWRTPLLVLVGLAVGIGLAIGVPALLDRDDGGSEPSTTAEGLTLDEARGDVVDQLGDGEVPPGAGAESPVEAVEGFLAAEAEEAYLESFGFLSAADRQQFRTPEGWVANHASLLAPVLDYEISEVSEDGEGAEVASLVSFEPGLNQVTGLTSGEAAIVWAVVPDEAGSWGVDLEASSFEPRYPSDDGAPAAVQAWAESRQGGGTDGQTESLLGSPALADDLRGTSEPVEVGPAERLDDFGATPFTTAFGAETTTWARVVAVSAPVELRVVVAPIGDTWTVIGILQ